MSELKTQMRDLSLCIATVLGVMLAFPPGYAPWLAWFCLVPFGIALSNKKGCDAFSFALVTALFGWLGATWWVAIGVAELSSSSYLVAAPFLLVFCLVYALPYAISGYCYAVMGWTRSLSGAFYAASVFTTLCVLTPHILPGNLSHSQYKYPYVIQILELGGTPLLFFVLHWFNWLLVCGWNHWHKNRSYSVKALAIAASILMVVVSYGYVRTKQLQSVIENEQHQTLQVGWVQPNIAIDGATRLTGTLEQTSLVSLSESLLGQHPNLDLLIWPEVPILLGYYDNEGDRIQVNRLVDTFSVPMMVSGIRKREQQNPDVKDYFNVVEYVTLKGLEATYRKQRLLPFGEYIPFEAQFPVLRKLMPYALHYASEKTNTSHFTLSNGIKIMPLVCYETVFPHLVKNAKNSGASIIVNPVNDAWFGRTSGPDIHFALSLFRTVEYRVPLLRVTNSGISAHVSAAGTIDDTSKSRLFVEDAGVMEVSAPEFHKTLYETLGNWVLWITSFVSIFSVFKRYKTHTAHRRLQTRQP